MKNILNLLLPTVLTFVGFGSQAQVIGLQEVTTVSSLTLNECGSTDTIALEVYNCCSTDTLYSLSIKDTMPSGIVFHEVLSHSSLASVNSSNPAIPQLYFNKFAPSQKDTFYIVVSAECGAKAASSSSYFGYLADWVDNSVNYNQAEQGINIYAAIKSPNIQLLRQGPGNFTKAGVGDTFCRSFRIQNSSVGSMVDSLRLKVKMQPGTSMVSLSLDGTAVTPTLIGGFWIYDFEVNLRNVGVYTNDFIIVEECFEVIACLDNVNSGQMTVQWGCNGSICQTKSRISITRLSSAIPYLTTQTTYVDGCYGGYDTMTIRIINTGGYRASDIEIDIATGYSSYITDRSRVANYADTGSFKYYTPNGTPVSLSPSSIQSSAYTKTYFPIANHPFRSFTSLPGIESGDTLFFECLIYRACLDETVCGGYASTATNFDLSFTKECVTGANYSLPARIVANHEGKRSTGVLDGPTDLGDGDTATFSFCFSSVSANSFDKENDGYLHIEYEMPYGLTWNGNTSDLDLTNGTSSMSVDSIFVDTTTNTLHLYYDFDNSIARGSRREYCIYPKFYLDCSNPLASSGLNNLSVNTFDNFKPNCTTTCEIPYTCGVDFTYNAHCPSPCTRGGFNPKISYIRRTNLGLPDNDEDGFADTTGSLDMGIIEIDRVTARDTFILTYGGAVVRGIESPDTFRYGYGSAKFPNNGNIVKHLSTDVRIWDASTNTTFTVTGASVSFGTSGKTRTFFYNYGPTSAASGYPAGYFFDDADSIIILSKFVFNESVLRTIDVVNVVENFFYLSHYANPTNDTAQYRCDKWNAKLKTTDAYFTVWSPEIDVITGCNEYRARYRSYLSIGECCSNYSTSSYFKKEYRSYAITDSLRIKIPEGFSIDSANVQFSHGAKVSYAQNIYRYNITPTRVSGNTAVYYIGDLYANGTGTVIPSRGGYVQYLYVHYSPSCAVPANINIPRKYDIFLKGINSWEGYTRNWQNYGTGSVKFVSPVVSIKNQGSVVSDGANRVISWDVRLQNDAASAVAERAWLSFKKVGSLITVDSVIDNASGAQLTEVNGIYQAGTLLGGGNTNSRTFKVYAVFNSCTADSIMAFGGWDCTDYPAGLSSNLCNIDSTLLIVNPVSAVLNMDTVKTVSAPVDICDELEFRMSVSQRDLASAYNNFIDVIMPRGLTIMEDSSYIMYMGDSSVTWFNHTSIGPRRKHFDVSNNVSYIGTNGISEFANAPSNEYQLRIKAQTDCDFESGSKIRFQAGGTAPCGATLERAKYVETITVTGAPAITYQVPEINLIGDTLWGCSDTLPIGAVYHNFDTTNTSTGHKFRVTLPLGFSYISNSTSFTRNAFSTTEPTTSYLYGQQVLLWASSGNTPATDSSVWTFDVTSGNSGCGALVVVADITEDFTTTCVEDGSTCSSTSIVNSTSGSIITTKAEISVTDCSISMRQDTFNSTVPDSLTIYLDLTNVGTYDPGTIQVDVFQDMNANGVIDAGDVEHLDTILSSISVSTNSSHTFGLTAANNSLNCNMIVRIIPECACTDTVYSTPGCNIARLPVRLTSFNVVKINEDKAKIRWITAEEENLNYFIVERRLENELSFKTIGKKLANGSHQGILKYNLPDNISAINEGNIYYRLVSVDYDGNRSYSDVRFINKLDFNTTVYPNPAIDVIHVVSDIPEGSVELCNLYGQVLQTGIMENGSATLQISGKPTGMYFINVIHNNSMVKQEKIVISR